ncbi:hypothetical protein ABW19_dt0202307 [Dactylella cylindrospora]|nr:hypothetical protein ABW19_dt0202307 [Dactylella cylindrospora]
MVLKSSTLQVWVEKPSASQVSPKTHLPYYLKSTTFSPQKTTQHLLPTHSLLVNEAYVSASPGATYRIAIRVRPHWRDIGIQLLIDGVEQGNYICFNRFLPHESRVGGRRIDKTSVRNFKFSKLRVEDGHGNYKFDEKAHCKGGYIANQIRTGEIEPIEFMVGKKAVGTIRVNVYRVGRILEGGVSEGSGDWEPCTVVDDIGALKMHAGVESVTTYVKHRIQIL